MGHDVRCLAGRWLVESDNNFTQHHDRLDDKDCRPADFFCSVTPPQKKFNDKPAGDRVFACQTRAPYPTPSNKPFQASGLIYTLPPKLRPILGDRNLR